MIARKTKKLIYNLATIVLLVAGMAYVCSRFVHLGHVVYTDNAQVRQHITPVNTRVQGFIKKIYFEPKSVIRISRCRTAVRNPLFFSIWIGRIVVFLKTWPNKGCACLLFFQDTPVLKSAHNGWF